MIKMLLEVKGQPEALRRALAQRDQIVRLGSLLRKKSSILFMGIGSSHYALQAARFFLKRRIPGNIDLISAGDALFYLDENKKYDLVIIASQSGESIETLEAAHKLKDRGMEIWAITNTEGSSLYNLADEKLLMMAGDEVSSATKTYVNLLALLYALGLQEDKSMWSQLLHCADIMDKLINDFEQEAVQIAKNLNDEGIRDLYILGMGPHATTAGEAALLFKEKTWICTEGMSAAEFRHGSVEVIEKGVAVFILGCNPEVDKFLQKMSDDLNHFGAKVFTVGGDLTPADDRCKINIPWSIETEDFLTLVQVIPFQLISCFLAIEKGLDVDDFRHINKVISKY